MTAHAELMPLHAVLLTRVGRTERGAVRALLGN